jgi:hypothetical protein
VCTFRGGGGTTSDLQRQGFSTHVIFDTCKASSSFSSRDCCLRRNGLAFVISDAQFQTGTDVMIFKIFSPKNFAKKIGVFDSRQSQILKKIIITLFFVKTPIFSPKIGENRRTL